MSKVTATIKQSKRIEYYGKPCKITANPHLQYLRGNQHSYFSITGEIASVYRPNNPHICGCIHEKIEKHFPNLTKYIKWHLTDSTGTPMHYIANSMYHYEQGDKESFKDSCIYGVLESDKDFDMDQMFALPTDDGAMWLDKHIKVTMWLVERQPALKAAFVADMLELFPTLTEKDFD